MTRDDFKSNEEFFVWHWLREAEAAGFVSEIKYQPGSYILADSAMIKVVKQLKTKNKLVDKFLFNAHKYTPDFEFRVILDLLLNMFVPRHVTYSQYCIIDVKGSFNKYGDPKQFSINQKWMWSKYGIYVQKIVPERLFKKTWVPEICRYSQVRHEPVKKYIGFPGIEEFKRGVV